MTKMLVIKDNRRLPDQQLKSQLRLVITVCHKSSKNICLSHQLHAQNSTFTHLLSDHK